MIIVGIDEAGRGPLAGRVYAASVILDPDNPIEGLKDSKKLSEKKRDELFITINNKCLAMGIGFCEVEEIDKINIRNAAFLAMKRSLAQISKSFDKILVDGNFYPFKDQFNGEAIIKGDDKIDEIKAASIIAKVSRDQYMYKMDKLYPEYKFSLHKGYPTKKHKELVRQYGPSPIHRQSFKGVKEYL